MSLSLSARHARWWLCLLWAAPAWATTYTVVNTNDSGTGSLRQAILDANSDTYEPHLINFNIAGTGQQTITLTTTHDSSAVLALARQITIDGYSQSGASANTQAAGNDAVLNVRLRFSGTGSSADLFELRASGCELRGLMITNSPGAGVHITAQNCTVAGCFIGTDGSTAQAATEAGIVIDTNGCTIGGADAGDRNVISGNGGSGIELTSYVTSGTIQNNYIGTDADGNAAIANAGYGIYLNDATYITIGGPNSGEGNLISGNSSTGVYIKNNNNELYRNLIGTNAAGTAAIPNGSHGVDLVGGYNNTIGAAGAGNLISGNADEGIWVQGATNTLIQDNTIGLTADGASALGNDWGIAVNSAGTTIGGTTSGQGNLISGNSGGVIVQGSIATGTKLYGNWIGLNGAGTAAIGNDADAIQIDGASGTRIGAPTANAGNVIAGQTTGAGINLGASAASSMIENNKIGTNAAGTADLSSGVGILVSASAGANNTIGGSSALSPNLISGNTIGVKLDAKATVDGNWIGLNAAGTGAVGNGTGIAITSTASINDNIISGNTGDGIEQSSNGLVGIDIFGNWIGLNATGNGAVANGGSGVKIAGTTSTTLGASLDEQANVISGNTGSGVLITSTGSVVMNNTIGLDSTGSSAVGNGDSGIKITGGSSTTIGDTTGAAGNLISGNTGDGISITGGASGFNIYGNYIGTDADGATAIGNSDCGIETNRGGAWIGGASTGQGNVISGNGSYGVHINGATGTSFIYGNYIGVGADGSTDLGNGADGVRVTSATNVYINAYNVVSGNAGSGIRTNGSSSGLQLRGNFIGTDRTGAIDVGNDAYGLWLEGSSHVVGGSGIYTNVISGNGGAGVYLGTTVTGLTFKNNKIGTDSAGDAAIPNYAGIISQCSGNTIGGTATGEGNLISGNTYEGLNISAGGSLTIVGNTIGLDLDGDADLGNGTQGVVIGGTGSNSIGGSGNARNVISGNDNMGLWLKDSGSNTVGGNYIGTDAAGSSAIGNGAAKPNVLVETADNYIGGVTGTPGLAPGNVISGSEGNGLQLASASATNNYIQGNLIGTNAAGTAALPNAGSGVSIQNAVGTLLSGNRNVISGNGLHGVHVAAGSGTVIESNLIGLDINGANALGNGGSGIFAAAQVSVGDNGLNTISGNSSAGVTLVGSGANGSKIANNRIGVESSDNQAVPNGIGVWINGSANNTIGGTVVGDMNGIAGNDGDGILISGAGATGNQILTNRIGTIDGTNAVPNGANGVHLQSGASNTTIGSTAGVNLISGNLEAGLLFEGDANNNIVACNLVGTDAAGTAALPNADGLIIDDSSGNTVGTTGIERNIFSGNSNFGIKLRNGASGNLIYSNYIGTNQDGTAALPNLSFGITISASDGNTIGGTSKGNTISGNSSGGLWLTSSSSNLIVGNRIGVKPNGLSALANDGYGIQLDGGSGNTIGSTASGQGNIISGNSQAGIWLSQTSGNLVVANKIGTDANGTTALPNTIGLLLTDGASANTVGGTATGAGNQISGNTSYGVAVLGDGADDNVILGNLIGVNPDASAVLGNSEDGISIGLGAVDTTIGGSVTGAGNVIAGNGADGVHIDGSGSLGGYGVTTVTGFVVARNFIGTNSAAAAGLGNQGDGVHLLNVTAATIGQTGAGNHIAGNTGKGIFVEASANVAIGANQLGGQAGTAAEGNDASGAYLLNSASCVVNNGNVALDNGLAGLSIEGGAGHQVNGNTFGSSAQGNGGSGILLTATEQNSITSNVLAGNTEAGLELEDSDDNTIRGNTAIGNGGPGIKASGAGNLLAGNHVGYDPTAQGAAANVGGGLLLDLGATDNTIGGAGSDVNVISGNQSFGVHITDPSTDDNSLFGNRIGTTPNGLQAVPNLGPGVWLDGGVSGATIGSLTTGMGNQISGNQGAGVLIEDAVQVTVEGNAIGLDANGGQLGNGGDGVNVTAGTDHTVSRNTIAANSLNGVAVSGSATRAVISANILRGNGRRPIDLVGSGDGSDGITLNDSGDGDSGPNDLLNYPVVTTAFVPSGGSELVVSGFAPAGAAIDFYLATGSGFAGAEAFGSTVVEGSPQDTDTTTGSYSGPINGVDQGSDSANRFRFTIPLPAGAVAGSPILAGATLGGVSSELGSAATATGSGAALVFLTQPSDAVAGETLPGNLKVEIRDAGGRRVESSNDQVTLALTPPSGVTDAVLEGQTTVAAVNGVATFSGLVIKRAATGYQLKASLAGAAGAASNAFNITPAAAHRLIFLQQPANAQAGALLTPPPSVRIDDQFGNRTTSALAVTVVLTDSPAGVTLGGTSSRPAQNGLAVFEDLSVDKAGQYSLTAGADGLTGAQSSSFAVNAGAISPTTSTVTAEPATALADGAQASNVAVTVRDGSGNPVQGVTVTLAGQPEDGLSITQPSVATGTDGVAQGAVRSTRAGEVRVIATAGGVTLNQQPIVTFGAAAPSTERSTLTADKTAAAADGVELVTFTITVRDAHGNPRPGVPASELRLTTTGSDVVLRQPESATDSNGRTTASASSTRAQLASFDATVGGTPIGAAVPVQFAPGGAAAGRSGLTADKTSAVADGVETVTFTITVRDAQGNPRPGVQPSEVQLTTSGADLILTQPATATDEQGRTTASARTSRAQTANFGALVGGQAVEGTVAVTFTAGGAAAGRSTLAADKTSAVADGLDAVTFTITVRDAQGNPRSGVPATEVRLTTTSSDVVVRQPEAATDSNGQTTANASSTRAQSASFDAIVGGAPIGASLTVQFVPGGAAAGRSTLAADKTSATADGADTVVFTITVRDAQGNPRPGVPASELRLITSGSDMVLDQPSAETDAEGKTQARARTTRAQTATFGATVGGQAVETTVTVTFTTGGASRANSTMAVDRDAALADGEEAIGVAFTVKDAHGNPVAGLAADRLRLVAEVDGLLIDQPSEPTNSDGVAKARLRSRRAGTYRVTGQLDGEAIGSVDMVFRPGAASAAESTLAFDHQSVVADGLATITGTLTLLDVNRNAVPGVAPETVEIAASSPIEADGLVVEPPAQPSDGAGQMIFRLKSTRPQSVDIDVTVGALAFADELIFTPRLVDADRSEVRLEPAKIAADGEEEARLAVVLRDATGQPVEGIAPEQRELSVSGPEDGLTVQNEGSTSDQAGRFEAVLTADEPGSYELTVELGSLQLAPATLRAFEYIDLALSPGVHFLSLPITPDADSLARLRSAASAPLTRYDALTNRYVPLAEGELPVPGQGLWTRLSQAVDYRLQGVLPPSGPQRLVLRQGWNAVGNPFTGTLGWDLAAIQVEVAGQVVGTLADQSLWTNRVLPFGWSYHPAFGYQLVFDPSRPGFGGALGGLPPMAGLWVRAHTGNIALVLPEPRAGARSRATRQVNPRDWAVALTATLNDSSDTGNLFGVASDLTRALPIAAPPEVDDGAAVDLIFDEQSEPLAGLIQTAGNSQSWSAVVRARQAGEVTLSWPSLLRQIPAGLVVELHDLQTRQTVLLNTRASYRYQATRAGEERRFQLRSRYGHIERSEVVGLSVTPGRGRGLSLSLQLSGAAEVTVRIRGLGGRLVKEYRTTVGAGLSQVDWDGTDQNGRRVPAGTYLLEALAQSPNGALSKATRTVTVP